MSTATVDYHERAQVALLCLADRPAEEPISAVEAWALATKLTDDADAIRDWWPKMAGRPAEAVRSHSKAVREAKPEMRQALMTRFAKENPSLKRRS